MDEIHFCEYKILLRPERFVTPDDVADFRRHLADLATRCGAEIGSEVAEKGPAIRFVTFFDSPGFDLYRNAFILRERASPDPGAPVELTFKFRHPDLAKAARVDVRMQGTGKADIKFKEEVLQPRDGSAGARSVYSHNCVLRANGIAAPRRMDELVARFPALASLQVAVDAPIAIVNDKTIEERQVETGVLAFGRGLSAKSSVAIWWDRKTETPIAGEFSYQTKFDSLTAVDPRARDRADHLHFKLQRLMAGWVSTGATKTSLIYGNGVGHE